MVRWCVIVCLVLLLTPDMPAQKTKAGKETGVKSGKSIYEFALQTIDGTQKSLSAYKGSVLLIVNTASECGYTPQYETLQKLYETYKDRGFHIAAFPANDFGAQEPGTNAEIKSFCSKQFHVTFDLFGKITVKGKEMHPLYRYLTEESPFPGEIKWNFQKYLVDRGGKVVARYLSAVDPMSKQVREDVEKYLKQ